MIALNKRAVASMLALANDDASAGSREALAQVLDDASSLAGDDYTRGYLRGVADSLRLHSRARRERPTVIQ